jgi:hypothetical protein
MGAPGDLMLRYVGAMRPAGPGVLDAASAATLSSLLEQAARTVILIVMSVKGVELVKDIVRQILNRR